MGEVTTVDVMVPVYNEETDVGKNVPALMKFLSEARFPYDWRIVIADNGSTDRTPEVSRRLAEESGGRIRYFRIDEKSKGLVIKRSWMASEADILTFMDVDLSTGLDVFPALVGAVAEEGYDIAIGSRLAAGSQVKRSATRRVLTWGYNSLIKLMFGTHFRDAQCGFKAARRDVMQRLIPLVKDESWFFDTELLILAEKLGHRVKEMPVKWVEDRRTSVKVMTTVAADFRGLLRLRLTRPWRAAKAARKRSGERGR